MPKDGFYYFVAEFRQREEAAGRRVAGGKHGWTQVANAHWQRLTRDEREVYNSYAKEDRLDGSRGAAGKLNCHGVRLSEIERETREKEARDAAVTEFVNNFVKTKSIGNLKTDEMFLIHVNIFCKTDDDENYYPAELAICKFNIQDGALDTYHTFIDPGEIRKGYMFVLKEHSQKYHKIMLSDVQENPVFKDYEKMYADIVKFLQFGKNAFVPLFTMYDNVGLNTSLKAVEKTLEKLWENKQSGWNYESDGWRKYFPIYPLALLFFQLQNSCCFKMGKDGNAFPNSSLAISELNKDMYTFEDGCDFHKMQDAVMYCSRSYVIKWAHIISDFCRDALNMEAPRIEQACNPLAPSFGSKTECKKNHDDSDDDNQSMVSGISATSRRTNLTEASIGFATASGGSTVSQASGSGSAWGGAGRGRGRGAKIVPPSDEENFPALGGVRRGVRNMKLN